jgi:hypothetical protein
MPYVIQAWTDFDPTTPISGDRLDHMEFGIELGVRVAEQALALAQQGGTTTPVPGGGGGVPSATLALVQQLILPFFATNGVYGPRPAWPGPVMWASRNASPASADGQITGGGGMSLAAGDFAVIATAAAA